MRPVKHPTPHSRQKSLLASQSLPAIELRNYGELRVNGDISALLGAGEDDVYVRLRQSETTGRPLGSEAWVEGLERQTGRVLKQKKRGRKKKRGTE